MFPDPRITLGTLSRAGVGVVIDLPQPTLVERWQAESAESGQVDDMDGHPKLVSEIRRRAGPFGIAFDQIVMHWNQNPHPELGGKLYGLFHRQVSHDSGGFPEVVATVDR